MSLRACEKCGVGFIPAGDETACPICESRARRTASLPPARACDICGTSFVPAGDETGCPACACKAWQSSPYRAPAPQTPEPTNIDQAEEFVRDSPFSTDERTIACALARIANVLERWEARGFK